MSTSDVSMSTRRDKKLFDEFVQIVLLMDGCPHPADVLSSLLFCLPLPVTWHTSHSWAISRGCWLGHGARAGTKGMNVNDMPPEMREAYLANKAAQKHAQRLAVSVTPRRQTEFMSYSRHFSTSMTHPSSAVGGLRF